MVCTPLLFGGVWFLLWIANRLHRRNRTSQEFLESPDASVERKFLYFGDQIQLPHLCKDDVDLEHGRLSLIAERTLLCGEGRVCPLVFRCLLKTFML
jgi:hypothetical protein